MILDLSYTSLLYMGLTCKEIKAAIWVSFLIRTSSAMPQQKCLAIAFLSGWDLEFFEWTL